MNVAFEPLAPRAQEPIAYPPFHVWNGQDGAVWTSFYRLNDGYLLRFPDLADFKVSRDGRKIAAWPVAGVSKGTAEHLYLNQVIPLALSRQGRLVFHASAVDCNGLGVAFAGESGRGKSTLATSFATSGSGILTDDGLQLRWHQGQCQILPSHPSIRLWADSQNALIRLPVELAPPVQYTTKARMIAGGEVVFRDQPQPLRRLYVLGDGTAPALTIKPLRPAEALWELVRNSFLLDIEERELLTWHFDELVKLADLPIYFRLDYPRRYDDLPQLRDAIIQHATKN